MYVQFFCYLFSFKLAYGLLGFVEEVHSLPPNDEAEVTRTDADVKQVPAVYSVILVFLQIRQG